MPGNTDGTNESDHPADSIDEQEQPLSNEERRRGALVKSVEAPMRLALAAARPVQVQHVGGPGTVAGHTGEEDQAITLLHTPLTQQPAID